ncbi:MAG: tetratricopeptide repeat protein [Planctomycetota bacterium]|nr:MAG: tetratricopeptide repeat protein [Planctomycetota bacterium]
MTVKQRIAATGRCLVVLGFLAIVTRPAGAELTVDDLTGSAVSGVGPYRQDVEDAIKAFAGRNYGAALERLQNAKKVTPALAPAEVMMAQLHFDAGQPLPAIAMLERALKSAPNDPEAYVLLIERALAEGRFTEAGLLYDKLDGVIAAFNQSPKRRDLLRRRAYSAGATIAEAQGDIKGAQTRLENLLKLNPSDASAHTRLGQMRFRQGDDRGAYTAFQSASADKKALPAALMMAMLWAEKNKANAEKWLDAAVKAAPNDPRTQIGAANYMLRNNRLDEAKGHAAKAIELDPSGYDSNFIAGVAARMDGDYRKADQYLSRALLLQPTNVDLMNHLALSLVELPDETSKARAMQYAQIIAKQNPGNPNIMATLGWVNYRLNRPEDAKRAFNAVFSSPEVRATQTMSSEMAYYLANLAKEQGNSQEAIKMLREALNTEQPFAYRKMANEMLAELTKSSGSSDAAPASTRTGS